MADLDCHIVELPRSPCRRSRVRWSFCDRYKQCDGVSKAKAAIRRTIVKRLTPCVERRMGSRESKILCKLFAAQKSAKIDARGMKGTWGDTSFLYCFLEVTREQYVHSSAKRGVARSNKWNYVCFPPHPCPKFHPHNCPKT